MSALSDLVAAVEVAMDDSTVAFKYGALELETFGDPPRIVAVPIGGPSRVTDSPGRRDMTGSQATRELYIRDVSMRWYCHADTESNAEQLLQNLFVAIHSLAAGHWAPESEDWITHGDDAGWLTKGACVILTATHPIGVPAATRPLSPPITPEHQGKLGDTVGCES